MTWWWMGDILKEIYVHRQHIDFLNRYCHTDFLTELFFLFLGKSNRFAYLGIHVKNRSQPENTFYGEGEEVKVINLLIIKIY